MMVDSGIVRPCASSCNTGSLPAGQSDLKAPADSGSPKLTRRGVTASRSHTAQSALSGRRTTADASAASGTWREPPWGRKAALCGLPRIGAFDREVELLHLHEGLHHARGFGAVRVRQHLRDRGGKHLPGQAELVLEPAAGTFLAALLGQRGPVIVELLLGLAGNLEGDRFVELELRGSRHVPDAALASAVVLRPESADCAV